MVRYLATIALIGAMMGATPARAGGPTDAQKVGLQQALLEYLDSRSKDGRFQFFDTGKGELVGLYPASLHPMIVPHENYYFLCADFRSDDGEQLQLDFVAVDLGEHFTVIQTLANQRDMVVKIAKSSRN